MNINYKIFLVIVLGLTHFVHAQENNNIYYDANWEETIKEKAHFYRPMPLKEKEDLVLIKDYYINGNIQMEGWAKKDDERVFEGTIKWYYENGKLSSIKNYLEGKLNGDYITYYTNGNKKYIKTYINGSIDGEVVEYHENGTEHIKGSYKKGKPYQGKFRFKRRQAYVISSYIEGKKQGKEIAYDATNRIIAEGVYADGKKTEGTFAKVERFSGVWGIKIVNLKQGQEEGKQTYYNENLSKVIGYYSIKNGKKVGERLAYNNKGELEYKMIYKAGQPYDGTFIDEDGNIQSYKEGKLHGKQVKVKKYSEREQILYYENGILTAQEYNFFTIEGETALKGEYKNGAYYNGYFIKDEKELFLVDYYIKGKKKYQYSKEKLFDDEDYMNPTLSVKSVYKNGEIYDGLSYEMDKQSLKIKKLKKGKQEGVTFWIFAMHYANNITVENTDIGFVITEGRAPDLKIVYDKESLSILDKEKVVISKDIESQSLSNESIVYYLDDTVIKTQAFGAQNDVLELKESNDVYRSSILFNLFTPLFRKKSDIEKYIMDIETLFENEEASMNFTSEQVISFLRYNEKGTPIQGILIEESGKKYTGKVYKEEKLIDTLKDLTAEEIKEHFKNIFK